MSSLLDSSQHQQRRSLEEMLFLHGVENDPSDASKCPLASMLPCWCVEVACVTSCNLQDMILTYAGCHFSCQNCFCYTLEAVRIAACEFLP